jgi:valyl-tRNA synthetase
MEKRYDHQACEATAQQQWDAEKTYAMENNPGALFSIDTPPPTVSGTLHIGHIFSYTQTDIIARYKRMNGFSVFYPFGFDDNGLPTERYVEKKRDVRGYAMSRSDFIALCIEESINAAQTFKHLWQKMGLSADWRYVYSTISARTRTISQASFIELYQKKFIYRKQEPALYCTTCRTTVAQAELDDVQLPSFFNDILFKDSDGASLTIATTRPELLPACVAVLYNPSDMRYGHLKGKKAIVPLFGQEVPLLEDELVDPQKGTGLVMVCTFGDKTDVIWYKKHNLSYRQVIGLNGKCTELGGFLEGLKVVDARAAVIEKLKEHNLLVRQAAITHTVNVHERCKKEIEFTILPQWFISILPYKQNFLDMADAINWHPAFMKSRYTDWVENLGWDWGISRQRFYGIPFPAWHCQDCDEILLATLEQLPVDPQETDYPGACTKCGGINIKPDTDVMDTWNTSSLTPYICHDLISPSSTFFDGVPNEDRAELGKKFLPMSMRPQAHDIIRTWAFDTIVKTWMHQGIAPWKDVVISGHVLSDKGKGKISKKDANAMDPILLLDKYPADAIRYWTATGRLGQDMMFSEDQLLVGQKLITKLWNAFKFAEPHFLNLSILPQAPTSPCPSLKASEDTARLRQTRQDEQSDDKAPKGAINNGLLHTISACFAKYHHYFEQQEYGLALDVVNQFFWNDFCDNYLELIKNQLFNPEQYKKEEVEATRWTLYQAGLRILQLYAPYVPHVTETIYQELYRAHEAIPSIHQTRYQDIQIPYVFEDDTRITQWVIEIATQVRKLKSEKQLSLKTPIASMIVCVENSDLGDALALHNQLIAGVTQAAEIKYQVKNADVLQLVEGDGGWQAQVVLD